MSANDGTLDPSENYVQQGSESTKLDTLYSQLHQLTAPEARAKLLEWSRQETDNAVAANLRGLLPFIRHGKVDELPDEIVRRLAELINDKAQQETSDGHK